MVGTSRCAASHRLSVCQFFPARAVELFFEYLSQTAIDDLALRVVSLKRTRTHLAQRIFDSDSFLGSSHSQWQILFRIGDPMPSWCHQHFRSQCTRR